jgi:hypothetical protein
VRLPGSSQRPKSCRPPPRIHNAIKDDCDNVVFVACGKGPADSMSTWVTVTAAAGHAGNAEGPGVRGIEMIMEAISR